MVPVDVQLYQFSIMLLTGMILGVVYDGYRTFRLMTRPGAAATLIYDTLFWVLATGLMLAAVFYASWGEVRAYVFLGAATGALLYFKLASPLILRLFRWGWRTCARIAQLLARVYNYGVVLPLRFVLLVISRIMSTLLLPFVVLGRVAHATALSAKEKMKKPPAST